jgi:hypothetical protein
MSARKPPFLRIVGTNDEAEQDFAAFQEARTQLMEKNGLSFEASTAILQREHQRKRDKAAPGPEETREEREAKSPAIKAAVRYIGAMAAMHEGFKADHTSDGVVAGFSDGGAPTQLRIARRALNKLILSCRLSQDASPVEMAAKASVAKFIMVQWRSKNWEIQDPKDNEGLFLDAFADQVEEMCSLFRAAAARGGLI